MADLCSLVKEKCGFMLSDDVNSIISDYQDAMDGMELCYICGLLGELELYRDDAFDEPIPTIYKPEDDSYGLCEDCVPEMNFCDSCATESAAVVKCPGWDGEGCRYDISYCPDCPWTICNECEDPGLRGEPEDAWSESEEIEEDSDDREFIDHDYDSEDEVPAHKKQRID